MPSDALVALEAALNEIEELQAANPTPTGASLATPALTRVIGRASVVLLSSHLERYVYAVNEEAVRSANTAGISGDAVPEIMRLLHSRSPIDAMATTGWEHRAPRLLEFAADELWLWEQGQKGTLHHERILTWMKSPSPDDLVRYYRHWGVHDIFAAITRKVHTRVDLRLRVGELVAKRNGIAHGDPVVEATQRDVRLYRGAVRTFCDRADRALAGRVAALVGSARPW